MRKLVCPPSGQAHPCPVLASASQARCARKVSRGGTWTWSRVGSVLSQPHAGCSGSGTVTAHIWVSSFALYSSGTSSASLLGFRSAQHRSLWADGPLRAPHGGDPPPALRGHRLPCREPGHSPGDGLPPCRPGSVPRSPTARVGWPPCCLRDPAGAAPTGRVSFSAAFLSRGLAAFLPLEERRVFLSFL